MNAIRFVGRSFVLLALASLSCLCLSAQVRVQISAGTLEGTADNGTVSFKGIPYAKPPVGELRWRAPVPPAPWTGMRKAAQPSAACIQDVVDELLPWTREFMVHGATSEDCLYLNVWARAAFTGERMPVYVYIHGGGFNQGSGAVTVYDGANLARKGMVIVTINYRLGPLGFMAHPELSAESPHHASGNYGLMDAIASLHWVRDNIAAFGGDPQKVSIGGQSAGAAAVHEQAQTATFAKCHVLIVLRATKQRGRRDLERQAQQAQSDQSHSAHFAHLITKGNRWLDALPLKTSPPPYI